MNNEKKHINNWNNSEKYKEFQLNLAEKKQELLDLKIKVMNNEKYDLSDKELFEIIKQIKNIDYDSDEFDFNYFSIIGKKDELQLEYSGRLVTWYVYLSRALILENYELCKEIKDLIEIEKREFLRLLDEFRQDLIIDKKWLENIKSIDGRLFETIVKEIL